MSLYKDASLVMIPSAYKDGKLYSIRPTDGSGDFTFSRGSNLAATRVDVNGLIEKGRENLVTYSNDFSQWTKSAVTATSGQSGYDGSSDAWLVDISGGVSSQQIRQSATASGVTSYSIYAKANTLDWILLYVDASQITRGYFDIANGVLGGANNLIDSKIESVGNGYYRCTIVFSDSITQVRLYLASGDGNITQSSGSVYIQDAQLEQGLVATDYIETGTSAAQSGILEDMPRLDYSGGASCPSLLLEPQRTNGIAYSEYFDSYWDSDVQSNNITITHNATTSPEGLQNATKLAGNSTSNNPSTAYIGKASAVSSQPYVSSVFAKAGEYDYIILTIGSYTSGFWASFNLDTGEVDTDPTASNTTASIEDYGDGWYRCMIHTTNTAGAEGVYFSPSVDGTRTTNYTNTTNGVYIFGAQVEAGSYPTSYIPTYGTSQTRVKDGSNLQLDGVKTNGYFGDTYTLFFEFDKLDFGASAGNFNYLYDDINATCMYVYGSTLAINTTSGEVYTNFTQGFTDSSKGKFLVKYDGSEVKIFKDGSLYKTYTNPSSRWDNPKFYRLSLSTASASISYKQFLTFPTALTDSECIALTSI